MSLRTVVLVVRANGDVRVAKKPRLAADEVGIRLNIRIPDGWGRIASSLDVTIPEPPVATVDGAA